MANMQARTYQALGIPASTAGQPGHCALIYFARDPKTDTFACSGAQFVTAGPSGTHPHAAWFFGDQPSPKPMVYHQSIAWAINYGFPAYLDSTMAYNLFRLLPQADRQAHGLELLESGLAINPYNFLLADAGLALAHTPSEQVHLYQTLQSALATVGNKPGCPIDGLYNQTIQENLFKNLARMPVPSDKDAARKVYSYLQNQKCDNSEVLALYQVAIDGLPVLLTQTQTDYKAYLAASRTVETSARMAGTLEIIAKHIPDKNQKSHWASDLLQELQGHESYFGKKNVIVIDATEPVLAKLSGKKSRSESELTQSLLDQLAVTLKTGVSGAREPKSCKRLADEISAAARQIKDEAQRHQWAQSLSQIITGHENFTPPNARKNAKPQRDPCADVIAGLLLPPAAGNAPSRS